ncbi:MAG: TIGR03960 family B12-binding radical SAM protein [Deltaproteobacteria bacterium]|nr:TIGR03960 family B12-binding radical SAM protein [Deltaproteobacteria bacterium]
MPKDATDLPGRTLTSPGDRLPLSHVQRPSRYLGREFNRVLKNPKEVSLRVGLLFPDLYEVGMSHLGLALLYDLLNGRPEIWAERAFAPAPDLEAELRRRGRLLATLESDTPLREMDLVGVSLQYELSYTTVLAMLDLGGIPLMAGDRGSDDPAVVGGGPAAFNPEPLAPFFDAFVLGDGEEAALEVAEAVRAWRAARGGRKELWQALEELDGVYVPAHFEMDFDAEGRLREIRPRGRRERVVKRVLADLNLFPPPARPLVPTCQIVHDRLNLEIARGCTRGCRYCQAGMIYRPVRERAPGDLEARVEAALEATGYEELSLLTLSPGDYCGLPWLLGRLMDRLEPRKIALSLPSLRADTLAPELMAQIQRVRRTGLTIAPEAGSQRLRDVINKNLTEEEILGSATRAFAAGWQLLKLYFMIGLPTETEEDLAAIGGLISRILAAAPSKRSPRLNLSLSTFIPKSHTPFQWEGQADLAESRRRLHHVKDLLKRRQVQLKWNSAAQSWLEGVFSRGDRRLAPVVLAAYRRGCRLDAWSEHLNLDLWRQACADTGVDPDFYLRPRELTETLPWDHLNAGLDKDFLMRERHLALEGRPTPDCRTAGCRDCGVCAPGGAALRLFQAPAGAPAPGIQAAAGQARPVRYRLTYAKLDPARWLSHREMLVAFYRALRRSGLALAFTGGFHPLPRVSFHGALPVGVESLAEVLDLELTADPGPVRLVEALNRTLPTGLQLLIAEPLASQAPPPSPRQVKYRVAAPEPWFAPETVRAFLRQDRFPVVRRRPQGDRKVDLRPLVERLEAPAPDQVEVTVNLRERDNLKITEIIAAVFALDEDSVRDLEIMKIQTLYQEADGSRTPRRRANQKGTSGSPAETHVRDATLPESR